LVKEVNFHKNIQKYINKNYISR